MSQPESARLAQRLAAETAGTALLLATVVGSGIMAETLAGGNAAVALLCNTLATGAGLVALILMFGSVSAHFNPAVTLAEAVVRRLSWRDAGAYVVVQCVGAVLGVWLAHAMFDRPILMWSQHVRGGWSQALSEAVATFGLLCTIFGTARRRPEAVPFAVAAFIVAAYWFTASTSFANPAVTIARSLTDTFAGIRRVDVPMFIVAQVVGALSATLFMHWLLRSHPAHVVAHRIAEPSAPPVLARHGDR